MTTTDYAIAGYNLQFSEQPPYASSSNGMAFTAGVICRRNGLEPYEAKQGRGYSITINRQYKVMNADNENTAYLIKK